MFNPEVQPPKPPPASVARQIVIRYPYPAQMERIKAAASARNMTLSAFCREAIAYAMADMDEPPA